jgi:methylmalonyl-CoA mutase N-terminal domain/subunit
VSDSGYWEKPARLRTGSGLPVEASYDHEVDTSHLSPPGTFPYVRGLHADGYRGRLWTRREIAGFGSAADTNARFRFLLEQGATGLNCHFDLPTHLTLDPDHPRADGDVGGAGPSICTLADMRDLTEGIDMGNVSMSLISSTNAGLVLLAMYSLVAEERGIAAANLRGTIQNDPLHARYCGYEASCPIDLGIKLAVDIMEYCSAEMPNWHTNNVNMYDLREHGISAAQELAFGFGLAGVYIDAARERGHDIDAVAGHLSFYCSLHSDLLEEVAKLRAARLVWSRLMTGTYGAEPDSRAAKFRIGAQTAGSTIVPQQPLNNLIRIAYQALAGALAGVSSIHCCGFDEAIGLPSPTAHQLAVRTQQILAYETGVPVVADPLGGSYYVEHLTRHLSDECLDIMAQVDARGGMLQCVRDGWLEEQLAQASLEAVREVESGERRIVGVNWATEERETETPFGVHAFSTEVNDARIRDIRRFKQERDSERTAAALLALRQALGQSPTTNALPLVKRALLADATLGEIVGAMRLAFGLNYDPVGVITDPFERIGARR